MAILQTVKLKEELKSCSLCFLHLLLLVLWLDFMLCTFDQAYPLLNSFIKVFMPSALWYQEHGSQGTSSHESVKSGLVLS
jgi:hypothetical protein